MRFLRLLTCGLLLLPFVPTAPLAAWEPAAPLPRRLPLDRDTTLTFLEGEGARDRLTRYDLYLSRWSRFDSQVRMRLADPPPIEAWLGFLAEQAAPWTEAEIARLSDVAARVRPSLEALRLPWPREIVVIKTTGREEAGAAYCREAAIFLPQNMVDGRPEALRRLLLHELFHVLSNQNPELRARLYEVIGFQVCEPISLPPELEELRITNPDAPRCDCVIGLTVDGRAGWFAPVLLANRPFDPRSRDALFQYLTFRLMEVEPVAERSYRPRLTEGEARLLDPKRLADFYRQVGRNTEYIIHPDEILADNFVHLVLGARAVPSPQVLEGMRRVLGER